MGNSLGGYFVLYVKGIEGNAGFNNYLAASPSISYHDNYISKQFQDHGHEGNDEKQLKIYLTIGKLEIYEDPNDNFKSFGQILSRLGFIQLNSKVYKNLEHMGTAVPSFEDGVEFILSSNRVEQ